MASQAVLLERGRRLVFATAVDWPGWSRGGRTPEQALLALTEYAPRYRTVALAAGVRPIAGQPVWEVVEEVAGDASTDFGVPAGAGGALAAPVTAAQCRRLVRLVSGAWQVLDHAFLDSSEALRKGPRGGGRDRTPMLEHVLAAEASYGRRIGLRLPVPAAADRVAVQAQRAAVLEALGGAPQTVRRGDRFAPNGWTLRYAAHRIAWHVLDHAWEMQDKSLR